MSESERKTILILGGSYAGISTAHYLLRHVIPTLPLKYRVVLVNPSRNLYHKIAAPRAVVRPDLISPESLMPDIEHSFREYPTERFRFIQAYAKRLDTDSREVHLQAVEKQRLESSTILSYDTLVLATGASSKVPLWSPRDPKEVTLDAMSDTTKSLKDAKVIVLVGGGAVGVETAGELGSEFGRKKNITLYSGNKRLLTTVREAVGRDAERYLKGQGVKVVHNLRLTSVSKDTNTGKTRLQWGDGTVTEADVFLNTTGLQPNSEYVPAELLDGRGFVKVDDHFRVQKAGPRVYSIGSVASYSGGGMIDIIYAVAPLGAVIEYDLSGGKSGKDIVYKRMQKEMMIVPVGRSKGVGVLFDIKIPSWVAWLLKGRTFFASNAQPYAEGASLEKKVYR